VRGVHLGPAISLPNNKYNLAANRSRQSQNSAGYRPDAELERFGYVQRFVGSAGIHENCCLISRHDPNDWCHGELGLVAVVDEKMRSVVLASYAPCLGLDCAFAAMEASRAVSRICEQKKVELLCRNSNAA
jgi:hypothetical protein